MRKVAERLLQLYVFTVPWEMVADVPGLGPLARLSGVAAVGATVLAIVSEGRFRKPDKILGLALVFVAVSALSLLWTVSVSRSFPAVFTYAQLLLSLWVVRELARTTEQQRRLLTLFCFALYVPLLAFVTNFALAGGLGSGLAGPGVAPALVIGIPIAYHLVMTSAGAVRAIALVYIPLALVVQPLTGSRTSFIAAIISLTVMILEARRSRRSILLVAGLFVAVPLTMAQVVPQASWDRLSGIPNEIARGEMNQRRPIWRAGLRAFPERPLLGSGVGTYGTAISHLQQTQFDERLVAHNVFIGMLVEQGILGVVLFVALLSACGVTILRLAPRDRSLWAVLMMNWLVMAQSGSMERWKITWLLFALLAAQHAVGSTRGRALPMASVDTDTRAARGLPSWAPSTGVAASSQTAHR